MRTCGSVFPALVVMPDAGKALAEDVEGVFDDHEGVLVMPENHFLKHFDLVIVRSKSNNSKIVDFKQNNFWCVKVKFGSETSRFRPKFLC